MDLQLIISYAQKILHFDSSGHDFYHAQRVANTAWQLYQQDQVAVEQNVEPLILATGYLHDTLDDKLISDLATAQEQVQIILQKTGFATKQQKQILSVSQHLSYAANLQHHWKLPLWGQYVQDADRLDALGAIGIARAFAYGGKNSQAIYDPTIPCQKLTNKKQYRKHSTTTINHFYEKLLLLAYQMNTPAGLKLAQKRKQYMQQFLTEFLAEWNF
ncbi:HD domain-containing protein [Bombilactobacillus thymidiniphilus]|uniref:HD domain-containing protein n=1 Tax=Bombilactobacillus thymidiniphilus TaxID=2923363 RepID=A0ABY4PEI7_9LACO|nr:HD domain-containing protein [Bombilactobacillus thymidiniphilus]UQS83926.1 HD domain-containing protein [Bombilactobacillus thymidiniphilus]